MRRQNFKDTIEEREIVRSIIETGKLISIDSFIGSRKNKYIHLDSKKISKMYREIDFFEMFGKEYVKRHTYVSKYHGDCEILLDCIEYFTIKDDIVGSFRIEDFGENYLIPRSRIKKIEDDLIEYFESFGHKCEKINENYLNINKERVE